MAFALPIKFGTNQDAPTSGIIPSWGPKTSLNFALSEAIDGAAKNYNVVFGIIIGSGTGGGIVINKKILKGANYISGEWGHLPLPIFGNLNDKKYIKQ